jgi:hypothetical protein
VSSVRISASRETFARMEAAAILADFASPLIIACCGIAISFKRFASMQVELASAALTMAVQQRRPQAGLIHHSDRGVQYASHAYRGALSAAGITASMSRKADCYDNAPMESFLHTLKTELVYHRDYKTRAEAQRDIFGFIEGLQPNKAPFRIRIYRSGRDGAKTRLNPSTFSGEDHFLLKIFADGQKEREPIVKVS